MIPIIKIARMKIKWKAEFGADKYGNPVWHHRYAASIIVGTAVGILFGLLVLAVEL